MESGQSENTLDGSEVLETKSDVAKAEEVTLAFWRENQIFEKTLSKDAPGGQYVFYDGPPFATGLPHYGHLLQSLIKDIIPRYQTMLGKHVERRWGWDCHGLPLENLIEAELGLKTKKDIEDLGIGPFNEAARKAVLRYADDWKRIIPRFGRFVDMEHDYRTMDPSYSESVWWVFKTLYDKGLIYEGYKSMQLCPRCETTLSNFEVNQGYKDITDISVYAKFELVDEPGTFVIAWTTTPWTLPGNVALAINPEIEYVKLKYVELGSDSQFKSIVVSKTCLETKFAKTELSSGSPVYAFGDVTFGLEKEFSGKDLIGKSYKPVFDYYSEDTGLKNRENGWKIYGADFVTTDSGTGVVHIAPAFGDDDMKLGQKENLPFIQHVGTDGHFKKEVLDFAGEAVKPKEDPSTGSGQAHQKADVEIIKNLAHRGLLFAKEKIIHSYPHCWRCDTPLLNYASSSWFVKVTDFKDKLVEANKAVTWVPEHIKEGRFGNWLEGARDWAISRSRYWGAPLPVWKCDTCKEIKVIGSIEELAKNSDRYIKVIFARHGESEKNVKNVYDSSRDGFPLTALGQEQAKRLAALVKDENITALFVSPVLRARETAAAVGEVVNLAPVELEGLAESNEGEWEGKTGSELKDNASRLAFETLPAETRYQTKRGVTGESWAEVEARGLVALREAIDKTSNGAVMIVSHQGSIASMIKNLRNFSAIETEAYYNSSVLHDYAQPITVWIDKEKLKEADLHRPYIDEITFTCSCGGEMKRVPEVFDCWFESGSMPYGQKHYMGKPLPDFDPTKGIGFPADFIGEAVDQTRGWFYSLMVLGTALFGQSPYKNVICTGLILAEDGQKMSKKLQNYPDPLMLVGKHGADAVRAYIAGSPVVRGEDLNFSEKGVAEVYKKVILRLENVASLYQLYADKNVVAKNDSKNVLDQWIIARLNQVIGGVTAGLDSYELDRAVRPFDLFVDDVSTWYVRRSRDRFKGEDVADKQQALQTTKFVLVELSKLLAPVMPFLAERMYGEMGGEMESVHLESWPGADKVNEDVIVEMQMVREVVTLGLEARAKSGIKVRQPLNSLVIKSNILPEFRCLIKEEVNVKEVLVGENQVEEVLLDTTLTSELVAEGKMRDLLREVQDLRKKEGLNPSDRLKLCAGQEHYDLAKQFESEFNRVAGVVEITLEKDIDLRIEKAG